MLKTLYETIFHDPSPRRIIRSVSRYDVIVLADARRKELKVMVDDLNGVIQQLERIQ